MVTMWGWLRTEADRASWTKRARRSGWRSPPAAASSTQPPGAAGCRRRDTQRPSRRRREAHRSDTARSDDRSAMKTTLSSPALVPPGPPLVVRSTHPRRLHTPRATRPRGAGRRLPRRSRAETRPDPPCRVPARPGRSETPAASDQPWRCPFASSRASQTLATFQSRITVSGGTPSAPQPSQRR